MRRVVLGVTFGLLVVAFAGGLWLKGSGISARRTSWPGEERVARSAWRFLVPAATKAATNPVPESRELLKAALEHFADHCALCHANDGSGETAIGKKVYPPAPDLRATRTQQLSDGEIFYAIEQGIPWTAMPAWSNGSKEGADESWALVRFIRHLPRLTPAEIAQMEALNPKSPADELRAREIDDFLRGPAPAAVKKRKDSRK